MTECNFCNRKHRTPCKFQERMSISDSKEFRIALHLFDEFNKSIHYGRLKKVDNESFVKSKFFEDFLKLSVFITELNIEPLPYYKWLLENRKPSNKWDSNVYYKEYLEQTLLQESIASGFVRTLEWIASENKDNIKEYLDGISSSKLVHCIQTGKISPWFLYSTNAGKKMLGKLCNEEKKILSKIINDGYWDVKIRNNSKKCEEFQNMINSILF